MAGNIGTVKPNSDGSYSYGGVRANADTQLTRKQTEKIVSNTMLTSRITAAIKNTALKSKED